MIQTKYLIIIGAIVCLLILYYFYDEISSVKKIFLPTYQKTMELEAKLLCLEKKTNELIPKKIPVAQKVDSPAMTISYQSDMVKNGNLSVRYADLSVTEAKELLKHIDQNKPIKPTNQPTNQPTPKKNSIVQSGEISDFLVTELHNKKNSIVQSGEISDFLE